MKKIIQKAGYTFHMNCKIKALDTFLPYHFYFNETGTRSTQNNENFKTVIQQQIQF